MTTTEYTWFFCHNGHDFTIKSFKPPSNASNFHIQVECENCRLYFWVNSWTVSLGSKTTITAFNALDMIIHDIDTYHPSCDEVKVYGVLNE